MEKNELLTTRRDVIWSFILSLILIPAGIYCMLLWIEHLNKYQETKFGLDCGVVVIMFIVCLSCIFIPIILNIVLCKHYKVCKQQEAREIFSRIKTHPSKTVEECIEEAAAGSKYWKIPALINMWRDLIKNSSFYVYR